VAKSVAAPPKRSPTTLTISGRPAKTPSESAAKPCFSFRYVGSQVMQK